MLRSTVLVTGATGFIGSHLVEYLLPRAAQVRCLVRRSSSFRQLPAMAVDLAYGDLVSGAGLREAAEGMDVVIHLAGVTKALSAQGYISKWGSMFFAKHLTCNERMKGIVNWRGPNLLKDYFWSYQVIRLLIFIRLRK